MTVSLPTDTRLPPLYRFLRKKTWKSTWDLLPGAMKLAGGFLLEEFSRRALPGFGHLVFRMNLGEINGAQFGESSVNQVDPGDLSGQMIRLQMATDPDDAPGVDPVWKTVWVGVCEQQTTEIGPGADYVTGTRRYHCQDLFASFAQRMRVDHSGLALNGGITKYGYSFGHPGYNTRDGDGRLLGNLDPAFSSITGTAGLPWSAGDIAGFDLSAFYSTILNFSYAGSSAAWTDLQALRHVLGISRPPYAPWFQIVGSTSQLGTTNAWECPVGATAWDLANRILDRRRGRGLAFFDWSDEGDDPLAELTYYIRVNPQTWADVSWRIPSTGATVDPVIPGAQTFGSAVAVDLVGDHRSLASSFVLGDPAQHTYKYLETLGDPIQVLATLDYDHPALEQRWASGEETAFHTATAQERQTPGRFDSVWQLHGLPRAWALSCGDGGLETRTGRADFRCDDDGGVVVPAPGSPLDTAPSLITILHDLPLFKGYDYTSNAHTRYDAESEQLAPQRRPPLVLVRADSSSPPNRYFRAEDAKHCSLHLGQYGITVVRADDIHMGVRAFSGVGSNVGGAFDLPQLVITVGLELPHRIRMASGDPNGARKQQIRLRGFALWLAHHGAIWDLQGESALDECSGLRAACGATGSAPGLLRDDRDRLAAVHALAASWYLTPRRTATWALRDCGFLPSFDKVLGDGITTQTVLYPTIGQLVSSLDAAGTTYTVNTPITDITYTAAGNGVTTWTTDWADLNLS